MNEEPKNFTIKTSTVTKNFILNHVNGSSRFECASDFLRTVLIEYIQIFIKNVDKIEEESNMIKNNYTYIPKLHSKNGTNTKLSIRITGRMLSTIRNIVERTGLVCSVAEFIRSAIIHYIIKNRLAEDLMNEGTL